MLPGSTYAFLVERLDGFIPRKLLFKTSDSDEDCLGPVTDQLPALLHDLTALFIAHVRQLGLDVSCRLTFIDSVRADPFRRCPYSEVAFGEELFLLYLQLVRPLNDGFVGQLVLSVQLACLRLKCFSLRCRKRLPV